MARHAAEIPTQNSRFDRFAEATSRFVSEAAFFTISALLVVIWVPTILLFNSVDTWQLVLNTVTSVLAFLLIALLQNAERRYDRALHSKVDALADGLTALINLQLGHDAGQLDTVLADLAAAREIEQQI